MSRRQSLDLRLELLRMRGQIERNQVAVAMVEVRAETTRFGAIASVVSSVSGVLSGRNLENGFVRAALGALGTAGRGAGMRSLAAAIAVAALRVFRRHPATAIAVAAGAMAIVGWWLGRKPQPPAADEPDDG